VIIIFIDSINFHATSSKDVWSLPAISMFQSVGKVAARQFCHDKVFCHISQQHFFSATSTSQQQADLPLPLHSRSSLGFAFLETADWSIACCRWDFGQSLIPFSSIVAVLCVTVLKMGWLTFHHLPPPPISLSTTQIGLLWAS
jgi:hypothetical protein